MQANTAQPLGEKAPTARPHQVLVVVRGGVAGQALVDYALGVAERKLDSPELEAQFENALKSIGDSSGGSPVSSV